MRRVLVTGSTGFIGRHLVRRLSEAGDEVSCLVRRSSQVAPLEPYGVRLVHGDVTDRASLEEAVAGVDVVFHLAGAIKAFGAADFLRVNEGGVRNLADACAGRETPPTLVVVSSLSAAGPAADRPRLEQDRPAPVSSYGRSKLAGEAAAAARAAEVPVTIIRPPMVFGEGDTETLKMFRLVAGGWHLVPGRDGSRFSVIHAEDLADLLLAAAAQGERVTTLVDADAPDGAGVYYAADPEHPTYADLGRRMGEALGVRTPRVVHAPHALAWTVAAAAEAFARLTRRPTIVGFDKVREGTAGSWTCSAEKAARQLGWLPGRSLLDRLRQTGDWYRAEGWIR